MIKHLKLTTGDELVCEVLEDNDYEIPVRNALRLVSKIQDGYKFYTFKNFMVYQDRRESVQVIRADHIVSYANPPEDLIGEWQRALEEMYADREMENGPDEFPEMNLDSAGDNVIPFKPLIH